MKTLLRLLAVGLPLSVLAQPLPVYRNFFTTNAAVKIIPGNGTINLSSNPVTGVYTITANLAGGSATNALTAIRTNNVSLLDPANALNFVPSATITLASTNRATTNDIQFNIAPGFSNALTGYTDFKFGTLGTNLTNYVPPYSTVATNLVSGAFVTNITIFGTPGGGIYNTSLSLTVGSTRVGLLASNGPLNDVSVGYNAQAGGVNSVGIGANVLVQNTNSVGIGAYTRVIGTNAVAIGSLVTNPTDNAIIIGNAFNTIYGNGGGLTNLSGANITTGSINSNKFDANTLAALQAGGGGGGNGNATNFWGVLHGTNIQPSLPGPFGDYRILGKTADGTDFVLLGTYTNGTISLNTIGNSLGTTNFWGVFNNTNVPNPLTANITNSSLGGTNLTIRRLGSSQNSLIQYGIFTSLDRLQLYESNDGVALAFNDGIEFYDASSSNLTARIRCSTGVFSGDGSGLSNIVASSTNPIPNYVLTNGQTGVATFTGTLQASNFIVTNMSASTVNVGTLIVTNTISGVFSGDGNGLTNLNYLPLAGGTVSGAVLSTAASASNSPAANEFPTAHWVRNLFNNGVLDYSSTNVDLTATNSDGYIVYKFLGAIPLTTTRVYSAVTNGEYMGGSVTTNSFQFLQGPIDVHAFLQKSASGTALVHPEIYYSYDKTNWYGDFVAGDQSITTGTNLYGWVVSFPAITSTNAAGFYIQRRYRVTSQTATPDITLHIGTNFVSGASDASHIAFSGPNSATGNAYLANNQTFTGSNTFTQPVGIGTNPPQASLHVRASLNTNQYVAAFDNSGGTNKASIDTNGAAVFSSSVTGGYFYAPYVQLQYLKMFGATYDLFVKNSAASTNLFIVSTNGDVKVGVGTLYASNGLTVAGGTITGTGSGLTNLGTALLTLPAVQTNNLATNNILMWLPVVVNGSNYLIPLCAP